MTTIANSSRKRSFLDSYETADTAEAHLREKFTAENYRVERYGMDRRYETLSSDEIEGLPDLCLRDEGGEILCYLEVKSKRNEDWMFVTNQYQWDKYVSHAQAFTDPTYIVWVHLDGDDSSVLDEQYIEVESWDQTQRTWTAPDGNEVVKLYEDTAMGYEDFTSTIHNLSDSGQKSCVVATSSRSANETNAVSSDNGIDNNN